MLTLDRGASGFSQGCAAQTCLVQARPFHGEPPPVRAFDLPAFHLPAFHLPEFHSVSLRS